MRVLDSQELQQVAGGAPATPKNEEISRVKPATDVNGEDHPGRATGWCRGFGNLKPNEAKHVHALLCGVQ